jgi:hypothetical protein
LLGGADLGLDFLLGEAADFFFQDTGNIGHEIAPLGIWEF